ncbi:hypothetical protein B0O99DRAFT_627116 [Bisporella sp. PMI_857]|nr:hypothetical protein B0O99DRAFT_627116 [Bisporella sp. PMI_857]
MADDHMDLWFPEGQMPLPSNMTSEFSLNFDANLPRDSSTSQSPNDDISAILTNGLSPSINATDSQHTVHNIEQGHLPNKELYGTEYFYGDHSAAFLSKNHNHENGVQGQNIHSCEVLKNQASHISAELNPAASFPCSRRGHLHPRWGQYGEICIQKCENICHFCEKKFATAANLRKHVSLHIKNDNMNLTIRASSSGRSKVGMNRVSVEPGTNKTKATQTASNDTDVLHESPVPQNPPPNRQGLTHHPAHSRLATKTEWMFTSPSEARKIIEKCRRECPRSDDGAISRLHLTKVHGLHIFAAGMYFKKVTVVDFDKYDNKFMYLWSELVLLGSYRPGLVSDSAAHRILEPCPQNCRLMNPHHTKTKQHWQQKHNLTNLNGNWYQPTSVYPVDPDPEDEDIKTVKCEAESEAEFESESDYSGDGDKMER